MSEFEFTRFITIGQYLPLDSAIHRLHPGSRILLLVFFVSAITFAPHLYGLLFGLVIIMLALGISRVPFGFALRGLLPPLPFLLILAVIQILFNIGVDQVSQTIFSIGPVVISIQDLMEGFKLLIRFTVLILGLSLGSYCLSTSEIIYGLEKLLKPLNRLGIQTRDFVTIIQVMLRFLPLLAQTSERIAKAQASRGADWGNKKGGLLRKVRQIAPLIVPLFLISLRRAEQMALAMDSRGYGINKERTTLHSIQLKPGDIAAVVLIILAAINIILL